MKKIENQKDVLARIAELIKDFGLPDRRFAISMNIDTSNFGRKMKGEQPITENDVEKISKGANVNKEWLLSGEGDKYMEKKDVEPAPEAVISQKNGRPYYNVDFEMGYDFMVNDQTTTPEYLIDFGPYNKCDCWCNARGNSMYPTISSGDAIAIKEIADYSYLISGEIYAIVTSNELRTIKRVRDNGDSLTLIPDNKEYPEQTIPKSAVMKVFKVLGTMKMF